MKILIDARMMGAQQRGIGRYIQELMRSLLNIARPIKWVFIVREVPHDFTGVPVRFITDATRWYTVREQWSIIRHILRERPDIVHIPHFNVPILLSIGSWLGILPPFIVTIHDLLLWKKPSEQLTTLSTPIWWMKFWAFTVVFHSAIWASTRIIAVSDDVACDLRRVTARFLHPKIVVISEAPPILPRHDDSHPQPACTFEPYVLTVGSTYPHKNLESVARALQTLWRERSAIHWVHVGPSDLLARQFFRPLRLSEPLRIHIVGYQTDEELSAWYAHALALLYPSSSEGFGLPILEALYCGSIVITSDLPALQTLPQRIVSDRVLRITPPFDRAIVEALKELINTDRTHIGELSPDLLALRSWGDVAQDTMNVYEQCYTIS